MDINRILMDIKKFLMEFKMIKYNDNYYCKCFRQI